MTRRINHTVTLLILAPALLALAACGGGQKKPEYYDAQEAETLSIPEGLSRPDHSQALIINTPYMSPPALAMETKPPRVSSTTSGIDRNSRLNWSAQGLYLIIEDTADSADRRLGYVLENSGMKRIRKDDEGVYRFDYYQTFQDTGGFWKSLAFWSRDKREDYSGAYQAYVQPDGENARVYLKYADGTACEPDAAEHLLNVVRTRLG
ncbi:MAG: hypothetical protein HKO85_09590 [Xanthomonadales bacterium]|nr:hypothetical protein [Gammaproteobacteria bacterium]MBT8057069.1 hypothetical protein [Gammaproteobacteria bacterium]NNJ78714.1 hypothetical protein [Xanthomonadales bacterium]NNL05531.1 hypothetical protein [Xanthomonadales bacterium]